MNKILSVSQLNKYIKGMFEDELILHDIMVSGEVADFKVSSSNTYLVLKDSESLLNCYRPATTENIEIGTKILLKGTVNYFLKGGRLSFVFNDIKPEGKGDIHATFLQLKEKLFSEGLFSRKRELPKFIKNIAVITSNEGAAIHDFIKVLSIQPFVNIKVFHSKVQGENAAADLLYNFNRIINEFYDFDVVVVTRGGGGANDLDVFNNEQVARAVFDCPIPVISAIGHEVDYTLCDYCADIRVGTPSMAGEHIANINAIKISEFKNLIQSLQNAVLSKLSNYSSRLYRLYFDIVYNGNMIYSTAKNRLLGLIADLNICIVNKYSQLKNNIENFENLAYDSIQNKLINYDFQLNKINDKLKILSPKSLLSLGYAKVIKDNDSVSISQIEVGDEIEVILEDGCLKAKVTAKKEND